MGYSTGKIVAYTSSVCFVLLAIWGGFRNSPIVVLFILIGLAILSYELAEYCDFRRERSGWGAREKEPCLHCRSKGKLGKRTCPMCGGKGYRTAPKDRFRPPIQ